MDMGEKIKALREERGISQESLAEALDVSRQAVTKWESGASRPSTGNLLALCRVLEVPLETFTGATTDVNSELILAGAKMSEKREASEPSKALRGRFPLWVLWVLGLICIGLAFAGACMGREEIPLSAIGGAEGPTAIYVTSAVDFTLIWILALTGVALVGLGILLGVRRKRKEEKK